MKTPTLENTKPSYLKLHEGKNPYYIVSPKYSRTSAGIVVLHNLCHTLNLAGKEAYLIVDYIYPWEKYSKKLCCEALKTPLLTKDIIQKHKKQNLIPIVIYPEVYSGRPHGGSCIVRYLLNFPGVLGGDKEFSEDELCFSYSKNIAQKMKGQNNVLYMPISEMHVFHPPENAAQPRTITSFYGGKYQGQLLDVTKDAVRITRKMSQNEIVDIFQRSKFFYAYESTALGLEAVLCGCPTIFLLTIVQEDMIGSHELGMEGYAIGINELAIKNAVETVQNGIENYINSYSLYWKQFEIFVTLTQEHAKKCQKESFIALKAGFLHQFFLLKRIFFHIVRKIYNQYVR